MEKKRFDSCCFPCEELQVPERKQMQQGHQEQPEVMAYGGIAMRQELYS